jgi:hypothetical protein
MEALISEFLLSLLGKLILFLRHRNAEKVSQILLEKYDSCYANVGKIFILHFIAGSGAIAVSCLVFAALFILLKTTVFS